MYTKIAELVDSYPWSCLHNPEVKKLPWSSSVKLSFYGHDFQLLYANNYLHVCCCLLTNEICWSLVISFWGIVTCIWSVYLIVLLNHRQNVGSSNCKKLCGGIQIHVLLDLCGSYVPQRSLSIKEHKSNIISPWKQMATVSELCYKSRR